MTFLLRLRTLFQHRHGNVHKCSSPILHAQVSEVIIAALQHVVLQHLAALLAYIPREVFLILHNLIQFTDLGRQNCEYILSNI